ncbi:MAG: NusA-like transcription termination signal-binding factor [Candidatus Diapherotrites archaeon]
MKLEMEEIFFINALDAETGVIAKDCIISPKMVTFLVKNEDMGKAIGPKGIKIKNLSKKLGRKVELLAFFESPEEFFRKAFPETEFGEIKKEQNSLVLQINSMEKKRMMQDTGKFKRIKKIAERNYNITGIKMK